METNELLSNIKKLTDFEFKLNTESNKFEISLNHEEEHQFFYGITKEIEFVLEVNYLDGKNDFLKKVRTLLNNNMKIWEDLFIKKDLSINLMMRDSEDRKYTILSNDLKKLANSKIFYIKELIDKIDNFSNYPNRDQKNSFSKLQWGAIFFYADDTKLLPQCKYKKDKLIEFMNKHNINGTFKHFRVQYYEAKKRINKECNFPVEKLKEIIPFLEQNYNQTIIKVENDIHYITENATDY